MPTKWERMVEKVEFIDVYGIKTIFYEDAANLLARQHARMVRIVKKVKSVYVAAQAESERMRDCSSGKVEREAALDITHLQVGIDACNDILAALAKEKGGE